VTYDAWAVAAPGLEALVQAELRALGFADAEALTGGVSFTTDALGLARANLYVRVASRIVVRLASFRATAFHELERAARKVEWGRVIAPGARFAIRATAKKSRLYHSDAIAQRVSEAILRAVPGAVAAGKAARDDDADVATHDSEGPAALMSPAALTASAANAISSDAAQLFVVRFEHDRCTISVDTSGELLHRRGYRQAVARAPLRETLAAAMLAAVGYDAAKPLVDPFCGSGTLPIEAAMRARRIAPGLARAFASEQWPEGDAAAWRAAREEAAALVLPAAQAPIIGSDRDEGAVTAARANAERAGVSGDVEFVQRAVSELTVPVGRGLLITNPPYGIRVGERAPLRDLYARLGQLARTRCPGWQIALLSADHTLDSHTGLDFRAVLRTNNGGIPVRVVLATA
jgi:putative N6-adenine-specific DNA methylase